MFPTILEKYRSFYEDDWINYLQALFYNLDPDPPLRQITRDRSEQLFFIYNLLNESDKKSRLLFTKALILYLRSIDPHPTESSLIYHIIHFIMETRPIEQRRLLERIIRDESFKGLFEGSDDLHLLLIKSYIFIEDSQKLHLEEYVREQLSPLRPYSLYLIVYYYGFHGRANKALDYLCEFFSDEKWTANAELCNEIYHVLKDCVPKHLDLFNLAKRIIESDARIDQNNELLKTYVGKFTDQLKAKTKNSVYALITEDVLGFKHDNIRQIERLRKDAVNEDWKNLIYELKAKIARDKPPYEFEIDREKVVFKQRQAPVGREEMILKMTERVIADDSFMTFRKFDMAEDYNQSVN